MTQVQTMTNPELNRALAELMGYTVEIGPVTRLWRLMKDGKIKATSGESEELMWSYTPDYCSDPAASLEVQTAACKVDGERYIWELAIIQGWVGGKIISRKEGVRIATATDRERAEAAYITLQTSKG